MDSVRWFIYYILSVKELKCLNVACCIILVILCSELFHFSVINGLLHWLQSINLISVKSVIWQLLGLMKKCFT